MYITGPTKQGLSVYLLFFSLHTSKIRVIFFFVIAFDVVLRACKGVNSTDVFPNVELEKKQVK